MIRTKEEDHEMTEDFNEHDEGLAELDRQAEKRRQSQKLIFTKIGGIEISTVFDDEDDCFITEDSEFGIMELSDTLEGALSEHFKIAQFILEERAPTH